MLSSILSASSNRSQNYYPLIVSVLSFCVCGLLALLSGLAFAKYRHDFNCSCRNSFCLPSFNLADVNMNKEDAAAASAAGNNNSKGDEGKAKIEAKTSADVSSPSSPPSPPQSLQFTVLHSSGRRLTFFEHEMEERFREHVHRHQTGEIEGGALGGRSSGGRGGTGTQGSSTIATSPNDHGQEQDDIPEEEPQ